ncbi:hypothetical protein GH714_017460 [Hevea brasiliensis]|uniref:Uncharacterized protein n=1 Tax=Hevea brasiliensis TaxID=3981 RepID=A0A6A6MEL3_HEVBR|nr:hypothetical protein GH714_017460 [Hevea brasiliensis]
MNAEQLRQVADELTKRCLNRSGDESPTKEEVAIELRGAKKRPYLRTLAGGIDDGFEASNLRFPFISKASSYN